VHGSAELFVAWSGSDVVVDLISPANNIFGFEYEPSTEEDIATVADRTAPGLEDVDAQWASDNGQSAAELSPTSAILRFE